MLLRANDRLVLFSINRFVLMPILEPRHPSANGNTPTGHAFDLIGISPPPGSPQGALLCCDGSQITTKIASTLGFRTGRKYL